MEPIEPDAVAQLPLAIAAFVRTVRRSMANGEADSTLWSRIAGELRHLLADRSLQTHVLTWPETARVDGKPSNLLLYHDPDYGFVLNAQVLLPNERTGAHDHGESWNLYGVVSGGERIEHYRPRRETRVEGQSTPLEQIATLHSKPGFVDVVPPGHIHRKTNGNHRTVNVVVRSQHAHTFRRYRYDPDTGHEIEYDGPVQIPFSSG